jgi:hypothetical protein
MSEACGEYSAEWPTRRVKVDRARSVAAVLPFDKRDAPGKRERVRHEIRNLYRASNALRGGQTQWHRHERDHTAAKARASARRSGTRLYQ